ncbi:MAG: SDR family NAD(P)-dependent oxidoreductase [Oscillospiraceae bacterium]
MPVAIITGASSGLGKEFLASIAAECPEIDEVWLIARRKERLEALAAGYPGLTVVPIPLDLSNGESFSLLERILEERKPDLRILVNNAGYGKLGDLFGSDLQEQIGMTKLNATALTALTALSLPFLSDGGLIINVASIAAFAPTPGMAVYGATKAYVTSFTKALGYETRPRGINAISVCPGPMDTGFNLVAGIGDGTSPTFESLPKENPKNVARGALLAGLRGKSVYTGRFIYKVYRVLAKLLPHSFLMKFTDL